MAIDYDALETLALEQNYDKAFRKLGSVYVPGEGDNPIAMIIGEAPGAQEAIKRRSFVGPSGVVLRDLMHSAGLHTGEVNYQGHEPNCWLTNLVKFRPPSNRNPTPSEIAAARVYVQREWAAIGKPRVIIAVGSVALQAITGKKFSILTYAGREMTYLSSEDRKQIHIWPMIHPSFGLRNPKIQPLMERDWSELKIRLTIRNLI